MMEQNKLELTAEPSQMISNPRMQGILNLANKFAMHYKYVFLDSAVCLH